MKTEVDRIDATPSKRLYLSIIADYDICKAICELIDNALDVWVRDGRSKPIRIAVELDERQQSILVNDDAGGLPLQELKYVVAPGHTGTDSTDETIGIFGVGTKRAVVALAQDAIIRTRFARQKTYQVEIDEAWIKSDDWELPAYEVDNIAPGSTVVTLQKLRVQVTEEAINHLREHLGATYAYFLRDSNVAIALNRKPVVPRFFENWAFPPRYEPRRYTGILKTADDRDVRVEAVGGLARESSPAGGEYGVYVYCNRRLVARALQSWDVGFTRGLAGLPHPKVSLTRVLLFLNGDSRSMPWNSSKSGLNVQHEVFESLRSWLVEVVKDYATLSRIWVGSWPEKVFRYENGIIKEIENVNFPEARKSYLPELPKSRPRFNEVVTTKNAKLAKAKPWVRGLYEGVIAADTISKQKMEQRSRISLIVLDSTLEIAFKEFLVNESGTPYSDGQLLALFKNRTDVHTEVKKYLQLTPDTWRKIEHYYRLRCKLIHERDLQLIPVANLAVSSHGSLNLGELTDEDPIHRRADHRHPA